jgi:hypothetical protein
MLKAYHRAITAQALAGQFEPDDLEVVIQANLGQDHWLRGQIGHDEYHFDQNAFADAWAYIEDNRALIRPALEAGQVIPAQQAFGRLTHAAQDLYAHSNYVRLWLARFSSEAWPPPEAIDPFDEALLSSPELRSGKLYYPLEILSYVPGLKRWILPLLPHDSHAWMNLDEPARGAEFRYAFEAAVKRTRREYAVSTAGLPQQLIRLFISGTSRTS